MKTVCCLPAFVFAVVVAIVPTVGQQDATRPDFSGTWKLNIKKSDFPNKSLLANETMVITCSGSIVEMRHAIDGHEIVQTYTADGQPRTAKEAAQIETKAFWEKSTLIIEKQTLNVPNSRSTVMTSRWTISKDGRTLKSDVSTSPLLSFRLSFRYVYDKQ